MPAHLQIPVSRSTWAFAWRRGRRATVNEIARARRCKTSAENQADLGVFRTSKGVSNLADRAGLESLRPSAWSLTSLSGQAILTCSMETQIVRADLPSRHFEPCIYGVGAWAPHLHFAYDLVAVLKPHLLVELGIDRGESYFAFCQSPVENKTGTRCFGVDTWRGDQHVGGYDETTFAQVSAHNRANYETFSTLIRASFDAAREKFQPESIDLLHLDGLHTEAAVRHDADSWLPKVRP